MPNRYIKQETKMCLLTTDIAETSTPQWEVAGV